MVVLAAPMVLLAAVVRCPSLVAASRLVMEDSGLWGKSSEGGVVGDGSLLPLLSPLGLAHHALAKAV